VKRKENIYKLRKERGGKGTEPGRKARGREGKEVATKEEFKAVRDSRARTRIIVVDGLTMGSPQSVKSHRVTGLQTITIFATQKSGTARGPGKKSLLYRNRLWKVKEKTKVGPDLLGERTVKKKVTEGLNRRTSMAKEGFRGERKDTSAKGQGVQEQLVPCLTVARKERRAPNPTPDIRRRDSQTGDGTRIPIQDRGDMVQAIDVTTGLDSRQLGNRSIANQKVGVQVGKGGRVGKGERKRTKEMDELSFEGGWVATNAVKNFAYPNRSLTAEANRGSSIWYKHRVGTGVVVHEQGDQRNANQVASRVRAGRDVS